MRKEKHTKDGTPLSRKALLSIVGLSLAVGLFAAPFALAAEGQVRISTRGAGSGITRDPVTGAREMKTPDAKPVQEQQGPQTIIVAPQVYPDGRPGQHGPHLPPQQPVRPR